MQDPVTLARRMVIRAGLPALGTVDRLRLPPDRAAQLRRLRRRLAAASVLPPGRQELKLAGRLRALRESLLAATGQVASCAGCARQSPLPHGRWSGGFCCGAPTEEIFSDDELAALAAAGTGVLDLARPPQVELSGCVFRGPRGCALAPRHRPNICASFVCGELAQELHHLGRLDEVEALGQELTRTFQRFSKLRADRALDLMLRG